MRLCPADLDKGLLPTCPACTLDIYRLYFKLLVKADKSTNELINVAQRIIDISDAFQIESTMCKFMLAITFLQLFSGDIVLADQTYLNNHLNNSLYIRSKECELADDFIAAFKRQDAEKLELTQKNNHMNYLDKEIQILGLRLTLFKPKSALKLVTSIEKSSEQANDIDEFSEDTKMVTEDEKAEVTKNMDVNEFADEFQEEDEIDLS